MKHLKATWLLSLAISVSAEISFQSPEELFQHDRTVKPCPEIVDWDGDGKTDLLIGGEAKLWFYKNIGTAESPEFNISNRELLEFSVTGTN